MADHRATLVVAAHADDEILGCGGVMLKCVERQEPVHLVILGEGITSRFDRQADADQHLLQDLHADAKAVADMLKVTSLHFGGLPDNRFDEFALLDVVKRVERIVEQVKPNTIYTHHGADLNIDHQVTHRAVLTATRPMQGCPVKQIFAFEVPSNTEWGFQQFGPFTANVFHDITTAIDRKIECMERYTSERRPWPHPRSPEAIRATARRWGSVVGADYAEAFELIRALHD